MDKCFRCGADCFDTDCFCPKCGAQLKSDCQIKRSRDDWFFGSYAFKGMVALALSFLPLVLCLIGRSSENHKILFCVIGFAFAVAMIFISKYIKRQIPETHGIRGFATLAMVVSLVMTVICFYYMIKAGFDGFTDMAFGKYRF